MSQKTNELDGMCFICNCGNIMEIKDDRLVCFSCRNTIQVIKEDEMQKYIDIKAAMEQSN